jgi:leucyl aminopeptidase
VAEPASQDAFKVNNIRDLTGTALRRVRATGATSAATIVHGAGIAGLDAEACAQAIAEGAILGSYRFRKYKFNGDEPTTDLDTLHIVEQDAAKLNALRRGVERGVILGAAACHTRDMANEPANGLPPQAMAGAQALPPTRP